jgi:hypothetical protein
LKKTVDRKSQGRPGQNSHVVPSDMMGPSLAPSLLMDFFFLPYDADSLNYLPSVGGLDDDKEELLSAINAARIACCEELYVFLTTMLTKELLFTYVHPWDIDKSRFWPIL